jgi:hypothetical protein
MNLSRETRQRLTDALDREAEYFHEQDDLAGVEALQIVYDSLHALPDNYRFDPDDYAVFAMDEYDISPDNPPGANVLISLDYYGVS